MHKAKERRKEKEKSQERKIWHELGRSTLNNLRGRAVRTTTLHYITLPTRTADVLHCILLQCVCRQVLTPVRLACVAMYGYVWLCCGCAQVEVGVDSARLEQALNSKHTKHKVSELIVEKEMQLLQAQPSKSRKAS